MSSASRLLIGTTVIAGVLNFGSLLVRAESPAVGAMDQSPTATIKAAVGELFRVLDDEGLKASERADDRRRAIEQVLRTHVSYEEMAQRALGAPWTTLTPEERREFVDLFVQLLRDAFANRINDHADEQVIYRGEIVHDSFAEVHTQLVGRKIDTTLDFRVVNHGGAWLVYDVVIDGASVVFNYRAQFTQVIKEASYVGLVKQMRQKTATLKRFETSPQPQPAGN